MTWWTDLSWAPACMLMIVLVLSGCTALAFIDLNKHKREWQ
jgi:hypothetical protein